jgi:hypothetical protein
MRKAAALCLLLLSGCAGSIIRKEFTGTGQDFDFRDPRCTGGGNGSQFEVQYLGSGGVYIKWRGDALLIGPYFSHTGGVAQAQFGHVHFDRKRIANGINTENVRAILFGHSHFDHIGDLPIVANDYVRDVPIYTNNSGMNLLASYPKLQARAHSVEGQEPITIGRAFRIRPIKWDHAPQLCSRRAWPCTYATGEAAPQTKPWEELRLRELRGGQTYAYVIELLDPGDHVRYRIYYNDAAGEGVGESLPDEQYDLAIICMASFNLVHDYPKTLLARLKPHYVLVTHYEDFFRKQRYSWTFVPLLTNRKANRFMKEMRDALINVIDLLPARGITCGVQTERWSMATPGSVVTFY